MSGLDPEARAWLEATGFSVDDEAMWRAALTHGSMGEKRDYERLEFLGDRVLGLSIAHWLFEQSEAPEGKLAQRLNAIVSREMCATIARGHSCGVALDCGGSGHWNGCQLVLASGG